MRPPAQGLLAALLAPLALAPALAAAAPRAAPVGDPVQALEREAARVEGELVRGLGELEPLVARLEELRVGYRQGRALELAGRRGAARLALTEQLRRFGAAQNEYVRLRRGREWQTLSEGLGRLAASGPVRETRAEIGDLLRRGDFTGVVSRANEGAFQALAVEEREFQEAYSRARFRRWLQWLLGASAAMLAAALAVWLRGRRLRLRPQI